MSDCRKAVNQGAETLDSNGVVIAAKFFPNSRVVFAVVSVEEGESVDLFCFVVFALG